MNSIKEIQRVIPNSFVAIRVNYDADTLKNFDSVLEELDQLDRSRSKIILKRIWQVDSEDLSNELILEVTEKLRDLGFIIDEFGDPGICFADRRNQAVINYDGNVFKCTTIQKFDEENALGTLDINTGRILWQEKKVEYLNSRKMLNSCSSCLIFPSCSGPCRRRMYLQPNWVCPFNEPEFDFSYYARSLFYNEMARLQLK